MPWEPRITITHVMRHGVHDQGAKDQGPAGGAPAPATPSFEYRVTPDRATAVRPASPNQMVWVPEDSRSRAAANNPRTPVPILAQMAMHTPELRDDILLNEATPPELRGWILTQLQVARRLGRAPRPKMAALAMVIAVIAIVITATALSYALLMSWHSWPANIIAGVACLVAFVAIQLALRW